MVEPSKVKAYMAVNGRGATESVLAYCRRVGEATNSKPAYVRQLYYGSPNMRAVVTTAPTAQPAPTPAPAQITKPVEQDIDDNLFYRRQQAQINELKRYNQQLLDKLEEAEMRFDALINIKEPVEITKIEPLVTGSLHEAVPIISISDIHIEETVDKDVVNGLNEYTPEIACERVRRAFQNALKLVLMFRKDTEINTVVIALLGDNITGYIHEDLRESNTLSPIEATLLVKRALIEGIKIFADHGFKKIYIPCARGNHGRTTTKKRFATGYKNSYEWGMYADLQDYFKSYQNVEFVISKSEYTYLEIYGKMNRFCHGDHFNFAGGIGGIFPSMFKFLHRINETIKADCTFMGHWHQYYAAARKGFVINGSVIGTNSYGLNFGNDQPVQNIQLLDSKYGYTGNFPIVL